MFRGSQKNQPTPRENWAIQGPNDRAAWSELWRLQSCKLSWARIRHRPDEGCADAGSTLVLESRNRTTETMGCN